MSFDPTDDKEELFPDIESIAQDDAAAEQQTDSEAVEVEKASKAARRLEPIVLAHVLGPKYQPVKPRVIARQLKLPSEQHKALKLAIKRLAKAGKLSYGAGHLVRAPQKAKIENRKSKVEGQVVEVRDRKSEVSDGAQRNREGKNIVIGTFRRTSKGFGFVRPKGAKRGDKSTDIYIAAGVTMDASDRDVVRVRLGRSKARGKGGVLRQAGEIVEIVERETHRFVGVYKERGGTSYVEVDGKVFAQPVPVGDPGAKGATPNDKVVIEMVRFPTHQHAGEAVIVEVLGARGEPGVDTLSIIREFGLPEEFPEDVIEDARQQAEAFEESI